MEKTKGVKSTERGNEYELSSLEGKVIHSETFPTGYGSCLHLLLDSDRNIIRWQNSSTTPIMFVKVGDRIRGFYHNVNENIIYLDAYELLNEQDDVLTRACQKGYVFVDKEYF